MFNFWWLARLVGGLESHPPPLSSQKNKMLIFGLRSISDDWLGWSMDLNPIHHPSPAKKIKCSFLDYNQRLMIGQAGQWTRNLSAIPLQSKNKMLIFGLHSTSDDRLGWSMDSIRVHHPSPVKKLNAHFWITFNFWWSLGWSMDSNPICHCSPVKKIKCSFLDYIQLMMIGWAGQCTQTLSTTPLQSKK